MSQQLPAQFYRDFSGGMVSSLNEALNLPNAVKLGLNVDFDEELGSATVRRGTAVVGGQVVDGQAILGLANFRDADGPHHGLLMASNVTGGATSQVYKMFGPLVASGLTAGKKVNFVSFLDSILIMNGADAPRSYNGQTTITTGGAFDLANIPFAEPSVGIEWLSRIYLIGDTANPDRLYYSSAPIDGAVNWLTTDGGGWIDIEPEDGGGGLKGLGKVPGFLLVFKERSMTRWNFDSAFPESMIDLGTPSHNSIINAGGLCAFFSASSRATRGFYITNGGRPVALSHDRMRNIKKWVDAIPQSAEANVAGYGDARTFAWSVGDLTVDGRDYKNVVLRYNRVLDQWSVRSYPRHLQVFSSYVDDLGNNTLIAGDDNGYIIELDKPGVYTDYVDGGTKQIFFEVQFHDENFGYNQEKTMSSNIVVHAENMEGARPFITAGGKTHTLDPLTKRVTDIPIETSLQDNVFEIGLRGRANEGRGVLKEVEMPNVVIHNTYGRTT